MNPRSLVSRASTNAARVTGYAVLVGGLIAAVLVAGFLLWIFPQGIVGYVLGAFVAAIASVVGGGLLLGARKVEATLRRTETIDRERRLVELTAKQGPFTVSEAARALELTPAEADAYLTELAKSRPEDFVVDIDAAGHLVYRASRVASPRLRVDNASSGLASGLASGLNEEDEVQLEKARRQERR